MKELDYAPSSVKRRRMMGDEEGIDDPLPSIPVNVRAFLQPNEISDFLANIHISFTDAALFRVVSEYADEYAPPSVDLPFRLAELFDLKNCTLTLAELELKAKEVFASGCVKITLEQARYLEKRTRKQSFTKLWNIMRAGLITASIMYALLPTDLDNPSITLIKKCCYPFDNLFMSYWMKRGLRLEPRVRRLYLSKLSSGNQDVRIMPCGFMLSLVAPWIGASPDIVVFCSCCGRGLAEIKCPKFVNDRVDYVRPEHLYQIQTQLFCIGPKYKYCDYIVYHPEKMTIKRVYPDKDLQDTIVDESKVVFLKLILPELLGRYFSALKNLTPTPTQSNQRLVCYCQKRERPPMVPCVGVNCTFGEFHAPCVGVRYATANWLCPQCKG